MGIYLNNISYSYGNHMVLKNINLKIKAGENIGIIGESGGGKSTLLKLISGLYGVQTGSLSVAGESSPEQIRKKVAMVMQASLLFPLSIRDNITCGHEISIQHMKEVCRMAQIADWIDSLPEGLDTNVGEQGGKVSGGQAQRIAIARAIAKKAPILLLDEATSALDVKTGCSLMTALNQMSGTTILNISHRREALVGCDTIYKLIDGSLELLTDCE